MGVVLRPTSSACMVVAPRAKKFGLKQLPLGGVANTIIDGFIVRAVSDKRNCIVTILELPAYLLGVFNGVQTGVFNTSVGFSQVGLSSLLLDIVGGPRSTPASISVGQTNRGVRIGASAPWVSSGPRGSIAHVVPSAVLAAMSPDIGGGENTLVVYRTNAQSKLAYAPLDTPPVSTSPVLGTGGNAADEPIGYIELGWGVLYPYGAVDFIVRAGACLEWGSRAGIASAHIRSADRDILAIARYTVTDAVIPGGPLVGSVSSAAAVAGTTIPDTPAATVAIARLQTEDFLSGYDFDQWAKDYAVVYGQDAAPGFMYLPVDTGLTRMWSGGAGYKRAPDAVITVLNVTSTADEGITLSAGATAYPSGTSTMVPVVPRQYGRHLVYVVSIAVDGAMSFTKMHEFHETRYNLALSPPGAATKDTYYPLLGLNTRDGEARMCCFAFKQGYSSGTTAPEPLHRVQSSAPITIADNTAYSFVDALGVQTPISTPGYFIRACIKSASLVADALIPSMGTSNATRSASQVSQGCANYAPGVMAAVVSPVADLGLSTVRFHIAAIDVDTGAMLAVGPVLSVPGTLVTAGWLSCVEQGTVDDTGAIATHATMLLTISQATSNPASTDGTYVIRDLGASIGWVTAEPSNIGLHYVGSPIGPARIGVSMTQ